MTNQEQTTTRSIFSVLLASAIVFAGGCSTDSGAKKTTAAGPIEPAHLSTADVRKDPDRIICRRHKPTGSRISEKICMTARQWQQASDDTARALDKAQRTTGGTDAN
jgi:hypothetical protein